MKNLTEFTKKYKKLIFLYGGLLLLMPLIILLIKTLNTARSTDLPNTIFTPNSIISTPQASKSKDTFSVLSTSPKNGEQEVSAGEITISFTTNISIPSQEAFSLEITPKLPYYWKFTNSYPTNLIQVQVYGGLQTNTTYTVTVKSAEGDKTYSWSFTTTPSSPESSSLLIQEQEKAFNQKYYPLFDFIPYYSSDFDLDYTTKLTLEVKIKNQDVEGTKKKVLDWIRSHDVDPSTHKIDYILQ